MSTDPHIQSRDDADEEERSRTPKDVEESSEETDTSSDINSEFQRFVDECGERYREALEALS